MAFRPDGRLILIRQETKGGVEVPSPGLDPRDHPRVCRAYELPEQGNPKKTAEISDFNWYVYDIATMPNGAYFAVQGISTATGEPAPPPPPLRRIDGEAGWIDPDNVPSRDCAKPHEFRSPKSRALRPERRSGYRSLRHLRDSRA